MKEMIQFNTVVEICIDNTLYNFQVYYDYGGYYNVQLAELGSIKSFLWFKWRNEKWTYGKWYKFKELNAITLGNYDFISTENCIRVAKEIIDYYNRKIAKEQRDKEELSRIKIVEKLSCT